MTMMVYMKTVRSRAATSCAKVVGRVAILLDTLSEGRSHWDCMLPSESWSLLQRLPGEPRKPEL